MALSPLSNRLEVFAFVFVIEVDECFRGFLVPPDLETLESVRLSPQATF